MASKKDRIGNKKRLNVLGEYVSENPRYYDEDNPWDCWQEMPHYHPLKDERILTAEFSFDNDEDVQTFGKLIDYPFTNDTKSIWYPKKENDKVKNIRFVGEMNESLTPKYPIYIVSKGRWETRMTSDSLIRMGVKHNIVVEASQYEEYNSRVDHNFVRVVILDQKYLDEYDTFDDLGFQKSKGPGAARNFAWDHSISEGHTSHWVMDDNIRNFYRVDGSKRRIVLSGAIFRAMEDHMDRYENVLMTGPNYSFFNIPDCQNPPFFLNTRIYSCNLIRNDCPFKWRGRYNEDTDISLRILKAGYCTIQYNSFLQGKMATQALKGGNTEEFYAKEGTLPKSKMLEDMHPDVAKVIWRNRRWHHYVDYYPFKKTRLILKPGVHLEENKPNEYGMYLKSFVQDEFTNDGED